MHASEGLRRRRSARRLRIGNPRPFLPCVGHPLGSRAVAGGPVPTPFSGPTARGSPAAAAGALLPVVGVGPVCRLVQQVDGLAQRVRGVPEVLST